MTIYFGDGIGDDPPVIDNDKTFTDDGYMVIGGQLIDLNELGKEKTKENQRDVSIDDDWMYR